MPYSREQALEWGSAHARGIKKMWHSWSEQSPQGLL